MDACPTLMISLLPGNYVSLFSSHPIPTSSLPFPPYTLLISSLTTLRREDYIRYAERRAALAGIVQSLLITKHLLFIGFSLVDDNFFQIISAVKKALTAEDPSSFTSGRFGTSLNVVANPRMFHHFVLFYFIGFVY